MTSPYLKTQLEAEYLEKDHDEARRGIIFHLNSTLSSASTHSTILDCACGDGTSLYHLRSMGFTAVTGVEINPRKAGLADGAGFPVLRLDMHDLSALPPGAFDYIVSSHTLEHAADPTRVLSEFWRLLRPSGTLHLVLPFPDPSPRPNDKVHCGKFTLCLNRKLDDVLAYFSDNFWRVLSRSQHYHREPELHLALSPGDQS